MESSTVLKEKHEDIGRRVLKALDISIMAKNAVVTWRSFVHFNSVLKYCSCTQKMAVQFWMNVRNYLLSLLL